MHTPNNHRPGKAGITATMLLTLALLTACDNRNSSSGAESHMERAETYAGQGQYRSAILEVRNALKLEPDKLAYRLALADLYMEIGAARQAVSLLSQAGEEHARETALPLARAYLRLRKYVSAREALEGFTPAGPEEQLETGIIRGEILRLSGQPGEAAALFATLVSSYPSSSRAMEGLLKAQLALGQNARAVESAERWLKTHPADPAILYLKGVAHYQSNQLEEATETLTEAATSIPDADVLLPLRRQVLQALSRVLTEQGRITEAQVYNRLLAENSNTEVEEMVRSAITAIEEDRLDDAKGILRDLLKLNPDNSRVGLLLSSLEAETGDKATSARLFTEYLDPETSPTLFIQAATVTRVDLGEREEAYRILARALEARPNDTELLAMHGILALTMPGHQQEGLASLARAIANEPEQVRLRLALARYYLSQQKIQQALGELRMAFTSDPSEWAATALYLQLLLDSGENQEAAEIRDALLNGYGDQAEAVILASQTDARLGQPELGQKRLQQLLADKPGNDAARLALASLYAGRGLTDQAVQEYVSLARRDPNSRAGAFYLQRAVLTLQHADAGTEVRKWLSETGSQHPELKETAAALRILASIRAGDLDGARRALADSDDRGHEISRLAEAQLLLAESLQAARQGDWQAAMAGITEARALEPDNRTFALTEADFLWQQGKQQDALHALDSMETTLGRQQDSLLARAAWLLQLGQEENAVPYYREVLLQEPDHIVALNNLAWILREQNPEEALKLAGQAAALAPDNPDILDTYAWILHLAGNHHTAGEIIDRAFALAPDNDQIRSHRASIRQNL